MPGKISIPSVPRVLLPGMALGLAFVAVVGKSERALGY